MPNPLSTAADASSFRFELVLAAPAEAPEDVERLGESLREFLAGQAADAEEASVLNIAVEELITNLGKFGADGSGTALRAKGEIRFGTDAVVVTVSDNGRPFDPTAHPRPPPEEDALARRVGGLGLYMLSQLFHGIAYAREEGMNRVVLTRKR